MRHQKKGPRPLARATTPWEDVLEYAFPTGKGSRRKHLSSVHGRKPLLVTPLRVRDGWCLAQIEGEPEPDNVPVELLVMLWRDGLIACGCCACTGETLQ